ncbi:cytochrome P450 82A3-like [Lotus japonicus]|uniref:cytochrome P450 82A3-like n=1 Tax=Lotus japonicus TaxID=34305 RepID=UPI002582C25E|nr:cytochrome P450 82A3-like [Lotus japonicus]
MKAGKTITVMEQWLGNIAVNVMFRTVIGKHLIGGTGICDGDEKENEKVRKTVKDFFHLMGSLTISDAFPFLRWFDLDGKVKKMNKTAKELEGYTQVWLEQHKRNKKNNMNTNSGFMDVLLSTVDDEGFHGHDADTIIKATCMLLILAGTDTTTGTLTWALSLLLNNREVLNKAKHELDIQIGGKRMVEESDLEKLEYLQAIIKETLRLYPAGPLGLPRESVEDCVVGGFHVPAHTRPLPNLSKLQRDPLLYSDPLEFRPERFLTTHKDDIDLRGQHFEFIPFGAGKRIYPGISFSLQLSKMTLATLLHGFEIDTIDGEPIDMVEKTGLTNIRATPLQVILTSRQSIQVYGQY